MALGMFGTIIVTTGDMVIKGISLLIQKFKNDPDDYVSLNGEEQIL